MSDFTDFSLDLDIPDPEAEKARVRQATDVPEATKGAISNKADEQVNALMQIDLANINSRANARKAVETLGASSAAPSAAKSSMLNTRLRRLAEEDGGNDKIAEDLSQLTIKVRSLDPSRVDFQRKGLLGRFHNPVERYLEQFKTAREEIDGIVTSLSHGAETLRQNNIALEQYETDVLKESQQIAASIEMGNDFHDALTTAIDKAKAEGEDPEKIRFLENEVLFPLEQRREDLASLLAVDQQAAISLSILRQTNDTLINNVKRTMQITVRALDTGVMLQRALADQKRVLEQTKAVKETTESIIAANARALHQQSGEIHSLSEEAAINPQVLQQAFDELFQTLEEGDAWRQAAIPRMQETVNVFAEMSEKAQKRIDRISEGQSLELPPA